MLIRSSFPLCPASLGLLVVLGSGCGNTPGPITDLPGVVEARSSEERDVLASLDGAKPGSTAHLDEVTYQLGEPYWAASGRPCVELLPPADGSAPLRLACKSDNGWAFVPDVHAVPLDTGATP